MTSLSGTNYSRRDTKEIHEIFYAEEVSEMARIPLATLYYYYYRSVGVGPKSGKLSRRVVYRRADIDAWIAEAFA